jgi:hypothetical protein
VIREKLVRCYTAANSEKLSDIDYLMKKYEGNEPKLFGQVTLILNFHLPSDLNDSFARNIQNFHNANSTKIIATHWTASWEKRVGAVNLVLGSPTSVFIKIMTNGRPNHVSI